MWAFCFFYFEKRLTRKVSWQEVNLQEGVEQIQSHAVVNENVELESG